MWTLAAAVKNSWKSPKVALENLSGPWLRLSRSKLYVDLGCSCLEPFEKFKSGPVGGPWLRLSRISR